MKTKKKLKKKPLLFMIALFVLGLVGTTFAYYNSETAFSNRFKAMTYNVTIEEEFNDDWGTKKVFFVNKEVTNTPIVLRINYNESWSEEVEPGLFAYLDNNINGENVVIKKWTDAFLNDFEKGEDGWYYYKKTLNANESVQVLESITLNHDLISTSPNASDYYIFDYELSFDFEAIQASPSAVSDIWSKTIVINGGKVTWK